MLPFTRKVANTTRTSFPSLLLVLRSQLSLEASKSVDAKTDGELSMLRMRITANSSTSETSSPAPISKTWLKRHLKSITRHSAPSNFWHSRRAAPLEDMLAADPSAQQQSENWAETLREWPWMATRSWKPSRGLVNRVVLYDCICKSGFRDFLELAKESVMAAQAGLYFVSRDSPYFSFA